VHTEAERLHRLVDQLMLADGSLRGVHDVSDVVRTLDADVGWLIHGLLCPIAFTSEESRWVDFRSGTVRTSYLNEERTTNEGVDWWEENESDLLTRTVYNIEVENTHTYFVGEKWIWVHNKPYLNGDDLNRALKEARNDILPPGGTRVCSSTWANRSSHWRGDGGASQVPRAVHAMSDSLKIIDLEDLGLAAPDTLEPGACCSKPAATP
jgi:hypothetical protein